MTITTKPIQAHILEDGKKIGFMVRHGDTVTYNIASEKLGLIVAQIRKEDDSYSQMGHKHIQHKEEELKGNIDIEKIPDYIREFMNW